VNNLDVRVPRVRVEKKDDGQVGIITAGTGSITEWPINEHAARMIEIARREGYETAKAELRAWMAPKGGPC
jgi:hypothetical protein